MRFALHYKNYAKRLPVRPRKSTVAAPVVKPRTNKNVRNTKVDDDFFDDVDP